MEKMFQHSIGGGTAYWVSDEKMNPIKESVTEEKVYIDFLNKAKGFKQDRIKFNSYEDAVKWAKKNFDKFDRDMIKYESVNEAVSKNDIEKLTTYKDLSKFIKANKSKINSKDFMYIEDEVEALKYLESDYKRGKADRQEVEVAVIDAQDSIKRAMGIKVESVNEGRELKSIQSDLNKTIVAIQSEISSYKATKGTPQEKKHVDNLKKLHPIKKKLESELESAVSGLYRDAELKIED
jgi:CO dehydrogenase/acetyl-CoA synthase delta subunit